MFPALALQIIGALVSDFPEILNDIKSLIATIEGQPADPNAPPLEPKVESDTKALADQLASK